jgi:hypothetical protein
MNILDEFSIRINLKETVTIIKYIYRLYNYTTINAVGIYL